MRLHFDPWAPGYLTGNRAAGPDAGSDARLDPDVETPASAWRPVSPPDGVHPPEIVLFVDGVCRTDGGFWASGDGVTYRGLAASYAAGAVRCDLRRGVAEVVDTHPTTERGLFTTCPDPIDLITDAGCYRAHHITSEDKLESGIQAYLDALESDVARHVRAGGPDLLVLDGPLRRGKLRLAHTLGYVKTHPTGYLPPALSTVVIALRAGERTPVFAMGSRWPRLAWYLRLPGPGGAPWAGVVRVECSAELSVEDAVGLADLSAVTLPRFASAAYKDPRAPQNLVPIAGLERRLRSLLGDPRLLQRMLVQASRQPVPEPEQVR